MAPRTGHLDTGHAQVQRPTPLPVLRLLLMHFALLLQPPRLPRQHSSDVQRRYARPLIRKEGHAALGVCDAFHELRCKTQLDATGRVRFLFSARCKPLLELMRRSLVSA